MRDPKIRESWNKLNPSCVNAVFELQPSLSLGAKFWSRDFSCETAETQQDSGEEANHSCVKYSGGKINYRTDEELVSSLGSMFIAINFLSFRHSFIIGM